MQVTSLPRWGHGAEFTRLKYMSAVLSTFMQPFRAWCVLYVAGRAKTNDKSMIPLEEDMTITRFSPFRTPLSDVALLQNRLNSIFNEFPRNAGDTENLATGSFVPA